MRKITLFTNVSLDGYFEAPGHDLSWTTNSDEAFSSQQGGEVDTFLFGRETYEMIRNFWSTPQAAQFQPGMARSLNENRKVVAAHAGYAPGWKNATVISGDVVGAVRQLKAGPGKDILIFGSNQLCASLVPAGLIDEFQIIINPVLLGAGTSLFHGLAEKTPVKLVSTRTFAVGTVMLTYAPVRPPA